MDRDIERQIENLLGVIADRLYEIEKNTKKLKNIVFLLACIALIVALDHFHIY